MPESNQSENRTAAVIAAAKWLTSAAGALVAALAAGLQFSGLGDAKHQIGAVAAFCLSLAAAALVIGFASRVMLPAYNSLADLQGLQLKLRQKIAQHKDPWPVANPNEIDMFATYEDMFRHLQSFSGQSPDELLNAVANAAEDEVDLRLKAADRMLDACNAYQAGRRYRRLLWALAVAGVALSVSVPTFALSIAEQDGSTAITSPHPVIVFLEDPPPGLQTDGCDPATGLTGLAVDGTFESPVVRLGAQKGCDGLTLTLQPDDRYKLAN